MHTRTHIPDRSRFLTISQHHLKAAGHLNVAARSHMEAAKLFDSGEERAAELQIDIARANVLRAGLHVNEAGKKVAYSGFPDIRFE